MLSSLSGQCVTAPITLEQRVSNSPAIVIGHVISQSPFVDRTTGGILTLNRVEVEAWVKGDRLSRQVAVITFGGVLGKRADIVTPSLEMESGRTYLLFLDVKERARSNPDILKREPHLRQSFAYADSQGALLFDNGRYHDALVLPPLSESELLSRIGRLAGQNARTPGGDLYRPRPEPLSPSAPKLPKVVSAMSPNPTNAGTVVTSDYLFITGSGFGTVPGTVSFANADNGGLNPVTPPVQTDYIHWDDGLIEVKVPRQAGTGPVTVNGTDVSPSPLTVNYAHLEINSIILNFPSETRQRYYHRNLNGAGGYTFEYNSTSGFSTNAPAVEAFERALQSWRCSTKINFTRTKTSTTTGFANDGVNVVLFDNTLPAGVLGVATSRMSGAGTASCDHSNTVWWLKEVDVQFAPDPPVAGFTWQYGLALPSSSEFDFETVAVHELGHAGGLGHRIADGEVMNYTVTNGTAVRNPAAVEIAGENARMFYSAQATCFNPPGSGTRMKTLLSCSFIDDPLDTDDDDDGILDTSDCAPGDPGNWAVPADPVATLLADTSGGNANFSWTSPANPGTSTPEYDVLRSLSASDFSSAVCVASNITTLTASDALAGSDAFYIVRVKSSCGSDNQYPSAPSCP